MFKSEGRVTEILPSVTLVFLLYNVHLIILHEQWIEAIPLFQFTSAMDVSGNIIAHCKWGHLFLYLDIYSYICLSIMDTLNI